MEKEYASEYTRVHTFGLVLLFRWKHMSYRHLAMTKGPLSENRCRRRRLAATPEATLIFEKYNVGQ